MAPRSLVEEVSEIYTLDIKFPILFQQCYTDFYKIRMDLAISSQGLKL